MLLMEKAAMVIKSKEYGNLLCLTGEIYSAFAIVSFWLAAI